MRKQYRIIAAIVSFVLLLGGAYGAYYYFIAPTNSQLSEAKLSDKQLKTITTIIQNLDTPWAMTVLPGKSLLVTERSGIVRIIGSDNRQFKIADVVERSEGGLLGLVIDPQFAKTGYIYIYKTIGSSNVVERYRLKNNQLIEQTTLLADIPAAPNHNGGAIGFGPDGKLYITTGDAQDEALAQDRHSLAGKILRIHSDGSTPADNPFGNAVWSYGHRNPQGLAWDDQGRLWSTEHGPSGTQSGHDELNLIQKAGNYGWPIVQGKEAQAGMIPPVAESGSRETWAPAGLVYARGSLYFTGLRGEALYRAQIKGKEVTLSRYFAGTYGRLRAITVRDTALLVGTSNHDGRGTPRQGDDKILEIPLGLVMRK